MKELMPFFSFRDNFLPPSNGAGNEDQEMEVRGEKEQLTNIQKLPRKKPSPSLASKIARPTIVSKKSYVQTNVSRINLPRYLVDVFAA